jgi:hypothetical protein
LEINAKKGDWKGKCKERSQATLQSRHFPCVRDYDGPGVIFNADLRQKITGGAIFNADLRQKITFSPSPNQYGPVYII